MVRVKPTKEMKEKKSKKKAAEDEAEAPAAAAAAEEAEDDDAESTVDLELEALVGSAARKLTSAPAGGEQKLQQPKKKKKMRWKDRKSIFVNQIPYTATHEEIVAHFAGCASEGDFEVRQVLHRKTKAFRGICFIDFKNEEALQSALALDQSSFSYEDEKDKGARVINIRLATDKKEGAEKDLTDRQVMKKTKTETSRATVEALVAKAVAAGSLQQTDIDERALDFLCSVGEEMATTAIDEFGSLDLSAVKNRGAFFMGVLKRRRRGETNNKIANRTGTADPRSSKNRGGGKGEGGKGGGKGKGKDKGKEGGKGKGKGKGKSESGKGRGKGDGEGGDKRKRAPAANGDADKPAKKAKEGGKKGAKSKDWRFSAKDACYVCGEEGHQSRACPKRK